MEQKEGKYEYTEVSNDPHLFLPDEMLNHVPYRPTGMTPPSTLR